MSPTRFEKIALGYLGAILCASVFMIFCAYTTDHPSIFEIARGRSTEVANTSIADVLVEFAKFVIYSAAVVFTVISLASAGAVASILLGEFIGLKRWWYYALAGALNGVVIAGGLFGPTSYHGLSFGQQLFAGGFLSGLVYWFLAVRGSVGFWDRRGGGPLVALRKGFQMGFESVRHRRDRKSVPD